VIETERLLLRKPTFEDAIPALDLLTDPVAMAWLGGVPPDAETDPEFPVRRWLERWDDNGCGPFSVLRRQDGRWLGRVGILLWDVRTWTHTTFARGAECAQPELGWAFASEHWGKGYATEAAAAAREWAYSDLGVEKLVSVVAPKNTRSAAVARRLGATPGEIVELFDGGPHTVWTHPR
jgi:RimJ/RimL family protein N-acetyltransferase